MLAMRPPHLRPRQAFGAVGAGGGGRSAGADLSGVPGGTGLGRRPGPVRLVRRHAVVDSARGGRVPSVWSHRESGRLAQLEERRPYKAKVGGSSPSAPTNKATLTRPSLVNIWSRSRPHSTVRNDTHVTSESTVTCIDAGQSVASTSLTRKRSRYPSRLPNRYRQRGESPGRGDCQPVCARQGYFPLAVQQAHNGLGPAKDASSGRISHGGCSRGRSRLSDRGDRPWAVQESEFVSPTPRLDSEFRSPRVSGEGFGDEGPRTSGS